MRLGSFPLLAYIVRQCLRELYSCMACAFFCTLACMARSSRHLCLFVSNLCIPFLCCHSVPLSFSHLRTVLQNTRLCPSVVVFSFFFFNGGVSPRRLCSRLAAGHRVESHSYVQMLLVPAQARTRP